MSVNTTHGADILEINTRWKWAASVTLTTLPASQKVPITHWI